MDNVINLVYQGNDAYQDALLLSLLSVIKHTEGRSFHIYFLTGDFSAMNPSFTPLKQSTLDRIMNALHQYNQNVAYDVLNFDESNDSLFGGNINKKSTYTPYSMLRLLIDEIEIIPDKVLYLDGDVLALKSVAPLYDIDLKDNELAMVQDAVGHKYFGKRYCNSGVMLMNVKELRKNGTLDLCRRYIKKHRLFMPDQTTLNRVCKKRIILPRIYNEQAHTEENTVIRHYCKVLHWLPYPHCTNVKPWHIDEFRSHFANEAIDIIADYEDLLIYEGRRHESQRKAYNTSCEKNGMEKNNENDILVVKDLVKKYGSFTAVNGISFSVRKGSLFAFLGLNGAGKSTTINIITSILRKNSGTIIIDGMDLDRNMDQVKNEIGIVFQNSVLDNVLTPKENLTLRAQYYGLSKQEWKEREKILVDILELKDFYNRPLGKLSGGQKRRVDIARAMVHDPKLLILDEPTTGLDPQTRLSVWNLINSLRAKTGMTVFLTTHYMEEAEKAAYVVVMDKGNIITQGTPTELKNKYSGDYVILHEKQNDEIDAMLKEEKRTFHYNHDGKSYRITVKDAKDAIAFIEKHKDIINDFEVEKGSMDDVFLNVTGVREILEEKNNG